MIWKPTKEELAEILAKHERWLEESEGWSENDRADLSYADLRYADLRSANLSSANLLYADLSSANLLYADLRYANLRYADLSSANLRYADLSYANLRSANLSSANLRYADLSSANLLYANLSSAENADLVFAQTEIVPRYGAFVGYKKAYSMLGEPLLVKLRIPEGAKRSNSTGRKCRCSFADVLEIIDRDGNRHNVAMSNYDVRFVYRAGQRVSVPDFCEDRMQECAPGIHFFLTSEEAWAY